MSGADVIQKCVKIVVKYLKIINKIYRVDEYVMRYGVEPYKKCGTLRDFFQNSDRLD